MQSEGTKKMTGFILIHRKIFDHPAYKGDKFSKREAWIWMIGAAAFAKCEIKRNSRTIVLERGQLSFSIRFLASKFGWSKTKVAGFINGLKARTQIRTECGTEFSTCQNIITICNYEKYQCTDIKIGTEFGTDGFDFFGTKNKPLPKNQLLNKPKKETVRTPFRFSGEVIKLTAAHFDLWVSAFPDLSVEAILVSRDAWLRTQAHSIQSKWFQSTAAHLNNLQQQAFQENRPAKRISVYDEMHNF
jgi:hypothetical protein